MKIFTKATKATKVMVIALLAVLTVGITVEASVWQNGTNVQFSKHAIDSNTYKPVVDGYKSKAGSIQDVLVTTMYDDDGAKQDNWKYSIWRVRRKSGSTWVNIANDVKVQKGYYTQISLDTRVTSADMIRVAAHGNNSSYDAQISGYIYDFIK